MLVSRIYIDVAKLREMPLTEFSKLSFVCRVCYFAKD